MQENPISIKKNPNRIGNSIFILRTDFNRIVQWEKEYFLGTYGNEKQFVSIPNDNSTENILDSIVLESGWKGAKDEIHPNLECNQIVFDRVRKGHKWRYPKIEKVQYANEEMLLIGHFLVTAKQKKQVLIRNLQTIKETNVLIVNEFLFDFILKEVGGVREIRESLGLKYLRLVSYEKEIENVIDKANLQVSRNEMQVPNILEW